MMNNVTTYVSLIFSILVLCIIAILGYNKQAKDQLMAKDIQAAISKGVNPIVIRCAYAAEDDRICLVYAATHGEDRRVDMMKAAVK
jgi:hypothetical protein